jgi:mRNA interferase HicA
MCPRSVGRNSVAYSANFATGRLKQALKRLGRTRGVEIRVDERRGKGSHGTLFYGNRKTTLKDPKKEIGPGLLHSMLAELGLTRSDFEE